MFWTAVIWGLGVALGASIGVAACVILLCLWFAIWETDKGKRAREVAELSLKALDERNELTSEQILQLSRIANALSHKGGE